MKLDVEDKRLLALWAAGCAEHVLRIFEQRYPMDKRPRKAVAAADAAAAEEHAWQYRRVPKHLRSEAFPAKVNRGAAVRAAALTRPARPR